MIFAVAHELLTVSTHPSSGQANLGPTRSVDIIARPELLRCNS